MEKLKICWPNEGGVQFKAPGIIRDWGEEMKLHGWDIEYDPRKWKECDLVFYGSDSQLRHCSEALGNKPTILFFWGWEPGKLLDKNFQKVAQEQLQMMTQVTRILVPGPMTMYQVADFGLPSYVCVPGVNGRVLSFIDEPVVQLPNQVMFLSRLAPHKQLEVLIMATAMIQPSLKLLVVGPGDRRGYEEMVRSYKVPIEFTELTELEKVREIRRSTVLVHPSSYEGFGLPPLESLYCGTPVIAFDIPQMRWLLQEDSLFFSTEDELAKCLVQVIEGDPEVTRRTLHGQKRVKELLTLEKACDRLWCHCHQVIKEHLATELRLHPENWQEIYDQEHKRNWAYGQQDVEGYHGPARFDPTWERHWRAQSIIENLKECKAQNVLDVGCGPVYPTILARAGFEVTALDISPECIEQVKIVAKTWHVMPKVHTEVGDALHLTFADGTFDAVVQGEVWEHIPDVEKVISEGLRVLKPGGYLIATTPIGTHHHDFMHLHTWDDKSLSELLAPWKEKTVKLDKISEGDLEPSCYLIVIRK